MKRLILTGALLAAGAAVVLAQPTGTTGAAPAQAPAAKGPAPKSKEEVTALLALQTAMQSNKPDDIIKASEDLRSNFPDTDFKAWSLNAEAEAYKSKNDWIKAQIFGEEALKADPKSYQASILLATLLTQHTGEHDFDRDEKLDKAIGYAKQTIDMMATAPKPNAQLPDEQWNGIKNGYIGEAYHDIALCNSTRKNYDAAIENFKLAIKADPQPAYQTQMADAFQKSGKNDEAIATCDQVLATPNLHPQIQAACNNIKKIAAAAKANPGK